MNSIPTNDFNVTRDNQQQPSGDGQRTPRVNSSEFEAETFAFVSGDGPMALIYCVTADFARELERENNALRARVDQLEHQLTHSKTETAERNLQIESCDRFQKHLGELLQAATERADALRRECEQLKSEAPYALLRETEQKLWVSEAKLGEATRIHEGDEKIRLRIVAERDAARAELAKWRDCADSLGEAAACAFDDANRLMRELPLTVKLPDPCVLQRLDYALTAYRALAAGQGEGAGK